METVNIEDIPVMDDIPSIESIPVIDIEPTEQATIPGQEQEIDIPSVMGPQNAVKPEEGEK